MSTTNKKDIVFSDKEVLSEDEFDPKYGKERVTILLDQQVVDAFREKAKEEGKGYQTLIRETLRDHVFGSEVESLKSRIKKIEDMIFKQEA